MKNAFPTARQSISAALVMLLASSTLPVNRATASELCAHVTHLAELAGRDFAGEPEAKRIEAIAGILPGSHGPADCRLVTNPKGKSHMCMWAFAYRDDNAIAGFDHLIAALKSCFDGQDPVRDDGTVNHPDSYDARRFTVDGIRFSVSVKDKAALEKTFVFLWVEGG